jgi:hypothetical protein
MQNNPGHGLPSGIAMAGAVSFYGDPSASTASPKSMIVMTGARNGDMVERGRVRPSQSGGRVATVSWRTPDRGCATDYASWHGLVEDWNASARRIRRRPGRHADPASRRL